MQKIQIKEINLRKVWMTKNYGTKKKDPGKKIPESQKIHITKLRNCCNRKLPLIMIRPDREFSFKIVAFEWKWRGFDWKVHISVSSVMEILYGCILKKYLFAKKKQTERKLLAEVFYYVNYGLSNITSNLSQIISVMKT